MNITALITLVILAAALLLGVLYAARRKGRIGAMPAMVLTAIIVAAVLLLLLYPSPLVPFE